MCVYLNVSGLGCELQLQLAKPSDLSLCGPAPDRPEDLGAALDALQLLDLEGELADLLLQLRLAQVHALSQPAEGRHQVPDAVPADWTTTYPEQEVMRPPRERETGRTSKQCPSRKRKLVCVCV